MALSSHVQQLRKKHQSLNEEVAQALKSPAIDDLHIAELKKQKLRLKEQIERLSR